MKKLFKITVKGKVHGVFYRASAKQMADLLSVKGLVRNESNGDVYIEAEAEEDMLVKFIQWCHHGPDRAEVTAVSIKDGDLQNFEKFEVQR